MALPSDNNVAVVPTFAVAAAVATPLSALVVVTIAE